MGPILFEQCLKGLAILQRGKKRERRKEGLKDHTFFFIRMKMFHKESRLDTYMLCRLNQAQLIFGRERQKSIQNEEFRMDSGSCSFKMKSLPNSGSIHECVKALRGGMQTEVQNTSSGNRYEDIL